ncbi:efflux RND transporter permease subunit [Chamaesiphon polymorphus]|uniref:Acriflavin resistance protein n=1 Tax=Chamaesiphon polymorphus CCALA 037 TaxID=2107692 RepID=A0A2T1GM82_9CYAN|nr:efflux RND transporter permease subunit [Chamaesiphon polymorphus]PSB59005.1 acriflavin resistance protein [Chamaesiphon polymorphus CCALA 037]
MNLIETAVRWRHGTFVLFLLLVMFGFIAMFRLPLELQPGGDRPEITISTPYIGAAPAEVENLITRPIEDVLEEIEGIQEITSQSLSGFSTITMKFDWGTDVDARLVATLNKLQQLGDLPEEAGDSDIQVASGNNNPMMWLVLKPKPGFQTDSNRYRDLIDRTIEPALRRVEGTSRFFIVGGQEREVEVLVDPKALADRNLSLTTVTTALSTNNRDIRGGPLVIGKREYQVRTVNRAQAIKQLETFVLRRDDSGTVYLRDVANVEMGRKFQDSAFLFNDAPSAGIGIIRRVGANVPEVAKGVKEVLANLEAQFDRQKQGVDFEILYDESTYIEQSVANVRGDLITGGVLAILVLLLFLGSLRTVIVVAISIPIAMIVVFIVSAVLGRSLNIISLAALGFAAGMVVDNAIVVIENIFTHMQQGKNRLEATIDGTKEVSGAIVAATLANVAVFAPLVLVTGEVSQLFIDMAITITAAAVLSMFACLTFLPMLASLVLDPAEAQQTFELGDANPIDRQAQVRRNWLEGSIVRTSAGFRRVQSKLESFLLATVGWALGPRRILRRLALLSIPIVLLVSSIFLLPPADYLPQGNLNFVFWLTENFPGTSVPEAVNLSAPARAFLKQQPEISSTFFANFPQFRGIGMSLKPDSATGGGLAEMEKRLLGRSFGYPGYKFMFPIRFPIFNDPGKSFEVQIIGPDLTRLNQLEQQLIKQISALPGVANARSNAIDGAPQLQVIPDRERLAEVGLSESEVGAMVEAALGGRFASQFIDGKEELDVTVQLQNIFVKTPEQLRQLSLYSARIPQTTSTTPSTNSTTSTATPTASGGQLQLADVATVTETIGPGVINHVDLERSTTLTVSLTPAAPLGQLVNQTESQILTPLRAKLPPEFRLELAGSADRLSETVTQLASAFAFSVIITYLLLVALYRSFLYPLVIMATVPMGLTGALLSLVIANWIPGVIVPLDMITGLGFLILTGVVVNNAILIVERVLQLQEEGQKYDEAIYNATRDRLRPIFMSAGTSILGIVPLAIFPGQGSELYQGLGIALTGGLAFSTILTPTVVPALMALLQDFSGDRRKHIIGS